MQNYDEMYASLEAALGRAQAGSGQTILVRGESGIGKSFLIKRLVASHESTHFVVKTRGLPATQSSLASIYESLYEIAARKQVSKEMYLSLLSRYSKLLPGFGRYITPLVDFLKSDALHDVIARSGVSIGTSPAVHVVKFIQETAGHRTVLWVVDDLQWVDTESWSCLVSIVNKAKALGWCLLLALNDRAEQRPAEGIDIEFAMRHWEQHANEVGWCCINAKRWALERLPELAHQILGRPCALGESEWRQLHDYTSGIPLYVASVLDVLKSDRRLIERGGEWHAGSAWQDLDVRQPIREALERRLKAAYVAVPKGRESLEAASVIGAIFSDEIIDTLLSASDSYQRFCEIEQHFKIIEYVVGQRYWAFDHNLIRQSIYRSLGSRAKRIHRQLAQVLATNDEANPLTIAFHYEQAGATEEAVRYKLREAERLLGAALFRPALSLLEHIRGLSSNSRVPFPRELLVAIDAIHGRLLFHTRQYQEALNLFGALLRQAKVPADAANFHRWSGRCLLKLQSPGDFQSSVEHLNLAAAIYRDLGDASAEGDTYTDLVVAHAHLNEFDQAEACFKTAERCFDRADDQLGMARLQRRNVIFMESELAAPILEQLARSFEAWGVPHEVVMSLNNAATEYLYLGRLDIARDLLSRAIETSVNIGDFGIAYLYCNLAIVHIVEGQAERARECIRQARLGKLRTVEELILDTADGTLVAITSGLAAGRAIFQRTLAIAESTGEEAYIIPIAINLATCLNGLGAATEALALLRHRGFPAERAFLPYNHTKWLRALAESYAQLGQDGEKERVESALGKYREGRQPSAYFDHPFALIDMQFWSD